MKRAPSYLLKRIKQQKQTSAHPKSQSKKKDPTSIKENTCLCRIKLMYPTLLSQ